MADGGEARAGALTLLSVSALPSRHIGQELTCLGVVEGTGVGVVDSAFALAERGCCVGGAGPLRGRFIGAAGF